MPFGGVGRTGELWAFNRSSLPVIGLTVDAAGIPVAAGVLYPTFGLLLSPIIAAAVLALSSLSDVGNALRLRTSRLLRGSFTRLPCVI